MKQSALGSATGVTLILVAAIGGILHGLRSGSSLKAETFVMAYACWRKGKEILAQKLYTEAKLMKGVSGRSTEGEAFRQEIQKELDKAAIEK